MKTIDDAISIECEAAAKLLRAEGYTVIPPGEAQDDARKLETELNEAYETVEELRAELRRYEPSDAVMYRLLKLNAHLESAETLMKGAWTLLHGVEREGGIVGTGIEGWLERHRSGQPYPYPLKDPDAVVLAQHTVIDEARRLFDRLWHDDNDQRDGGRDTDRYSQTWADIDEWRNRVLVQKGRETVADVDELNAAIVQAAELFESCAVRGIPTEAGSVNAWLYLPVVSRARTAMQRQAELRDDVPLTSSPL